ncbi:MAG: ATPase, T2SS/T4P/T4SS family [Candidatus Rehaiarchaeum fermentans]|nr:ATPase, T2SS/T4P/T4SS family [Candidatus Rehaiarchaeum fermentans]MCW1297483.1 ATPase, T2SS/T4P/T4SS family [Candidatus Rehaiarchaeum fermentans]MCW1302324.1 ATPase, T2SS/T4P/T4SS family [Candidatus Rehaiarchaeum fermentans]
MERILIGEDALLDIDNLLNNLGNEKIVILKKMIDKLEKEAEKEDIIAEISLENLAKLNQYCKSNNKELQILDIGENVIDGITKLCKGDCTLLTFSKKMKNFAEASSLNYKYIEIKEKGSFKNYFSQNTMSIHIKEKSTIKAKIGSPGNWVLQDVSNKIIEREEVKKIAAEILYLANDEEESFIEIKRKNSTIVQLKEFRIIIVTPPLSDGWEITITRSVSHKKIEDYNISPELLERLKTKAEGILIAGAPGMGKTTFAQALAEYLSREKKIIKTIESPRDMHLSADISQYSSRFAESSELNDILLLSRPDFTIFDEMRTDEDFKLYVDLRLAGIGMIGVVHATSPIDSIHRFVNRIPIGTITNVIDTVIYIHSGKIAKVYTLEIKVKMPNGLNQADLSRPVIIIKDFYTDKPEYEMYVFGEQIMIVPVESKLDPIEERLRNLMKGFEGNVKVENGYYTLNISKDEIERFNSKIVSKVRKLQKKTGKIIKINVI